MITQQFNCMGFSAKVAVALARHIVTNFRQKKLIHFRYFLSAYQSKFIKYRYDYDIRA